MDASEAINNFTKDFFEEIEKFLTHIRVTVKKGASAYIPTAQALALEESLKTSEGNLNEIMRMKIAKFERDLDHIELAKPADPLPPKDNTETQEIQEVEIPEEVATLPPSPPPLAVTTPPPSPPSTTEERVVLPPPPEINVDEIMKKVEMSAPLTKKQLLSDAYNAAKKRKK